MDEPKGIYDEDESLEVTEDEEDEEENWQVVEDLDRSAVNIADQMSGAQKKKLAALVIEQAKEDLESRTEMQASWERQARLYAGKPETSALSQRSNAPNIHIPGQSVAVDQYTARASKYMFPSDNTAKCEGSGNEDDGRTTRVAKVLNWFVEKMIPAFRRTGELAVKQAALFGFSALKRWWDPEIRTIRIVAIPAEDFIVSHTHSGTLESASRLTHRLHMNLDEIRAGVDEGFFCKRAWHVHDSSQHSQELEGLANLREEMDGSRPADTAGDTDQLEVFEQHRGLDLDGDGRLEQYICTVHVESETLMRVVSREVKNSRGETETPGVFTAVEFDYNPLGYYAIGVGAKTEGLNILQNSLANITLFLALRNGFPPKFCSRNAFKQPGDTDYELDEWIESTMSVDDLGKSMYIAPTVPPPPVLMELFNVAGEQLREQVSLTGVMMGEEQPHNQALGTTQILRQESAEMFNGSFRRMLDALTDLLQGIFDLLRLHLSDEEYNEILGDDGSQEYLQWAQHKAMWEGLVAQVMGALEQGIEPPPELLDQLEQMPEPTEHPFSVAADFADTLDILPTADPNLTSEQERMSVAQAVAQQVLPDPQSSPRARWAARDLLYKALRVPAATMAEINPEPEEPGPPPDLGPLETIVALLRGQPVAVLPHQKHSEYIAAIEEYKARPDDTGAWWQNTAPETREAIERHKQERMAAHLEQEIKDGAQTPVPVLAGAQGPSEPIAA